LGGSGNTGLTGSVGFDIFNQYSSLSDKLLCVTHEIFSLVGISENQIISVYWDELRISLTDLLLSLKTQVDN
jgi:hypothetical protein